MSAHWVDAWTDLLFPRNIHCLLCGRQILTEESYSLCGHCRGDLVFLENRTCCPRCGRPLSAEGFSGKCFECASLDFHFERALSCLVYDENSRRLIFELKYGKKEYVAYHLAEMMRDLLEEANIGGFDGIVPVPLHKTRERERGFNQALLLAEALGAMRREPVVKDGLLRVKETLDQTLLDRETRFGNLKNAFHAREGNPFSGKRILLIDDVLTTGATANECARILKEEGAETVMVATAACR